MKKIIIALGLGVSFLSVSAASFPSSGIDFDNSTVTIDFTQSIDPSGAGYNCSFAENTEIPFNSANANWQESTGEFEGLANCFHSAGLYSLDINLQDNAGNSEIYTELFSVVAGIPTDHDWDDDGILNNSDNCPHKANEDQGDTDKDGLGDACDKDTDGDGIDDNSDNCPSVGIPNQDDNDEDGFGDACDDDIDGDGVDNNNDNCVYTPNKYQDDNDEDELGDVCDDDIDDDGVDNNNDNCVYTPNPTPQANTDGDGLGDACDDDPDRDNDGILNPNDNCPDMANFLQLDNDADELGDVCDDDIDGDGVDNNHDNCVYTPNSAPQANADLDSLGDACDNPDTQPPLCPGTDCPTSELTTAVISTGNGPSSSSTGNGPSSSSPASANNSDTIEISLNIRDAYGNTVSQDGYNVTVYSPTTSFDDDANANTGVKFRDGLRVAKIDNSYIELPKKDGIAISGGKFKLRAIAPSIAKVGENIFRQYTNPPVQWLSQVVSREMDFTFSGFTDGDRNLLPPLSFDQYLTFSNPFASTPSLSPLKLAEEVTVTVDTTKSDILSPNSAHLYSILGNFCDYTDDDGDGVYDMTNCPDISEQYSPDSTNPFTYKRILGEPEGHVGGADSVALVTNISYTLGDQIISYPAGAVGGIFKNLNPNTIGLNIGPIESEFIGADIENFVGIDKSRSYLGNSDEQILNIGVNTSKTDIYEEIVENGWDLTRTEDRKTDNSGGGDLKRLFGDKDVVVVELSFGETFNISGELPSGKKTLVLIDANLKITGDLFYNSTTKNTDSFGVIVLRSKASIDITNDGGPLLGNIFVAPSVKNIAGSYFADGGFMNNDGNDITAGNTTESYNQLLLEGSLLSRNTLGGSLRQTGNNSDYSPWSSNATDAVAKRYDLHYVRRYDSSIGLIGGHVGINGEVNTSAFIIRPDQKATVLSPPGFKIQ